MRYYLDTSIWMDHYLERGINGEQAKLLLKKIIIEDEIVIYSDFVVKELKSLDFSDYEINDMMSITKPDNIKRIHITKEQTEEAKKLSKQRKLPFGDVLHAILSRDNHFDKLKDIIKSKLPEDLI